MVAGNVFGKSKIGLLISPKDFSPVKICTFSASVPRLHRSQIDGTGGSTAVYFLSPEDLDYILLFIWYANKYHRCRDISANFCRYSSFEAAVIGLFASCIYKLRSQYRPI